MNLWSSRRTLVSVALIVILLITLGVVQYRWVGELSEFERRRMDDTLQAASRRLQQDFDREIDRIWQIFHVREGRDVVGEIAGQYDDWVESFQHPELIDAVFWVTAEQDELALSRFDLRERRLEPTTWPPRLATLEDELREQLERRGRRRSGRGGSYLEPLAGDALVLVVVQRELVTPTWAVVMMRRSVLVEQVLPTRLQEFIAGSAELDYDVWVIDESDRQAVIYASAPGATLGDSAEPDLQFGLQAPRYIDLRRAGGATETLWSVRLKHRAGSLEAAVGQIRRRNLAVSLGTLALLGATILVLVAATRRAQSLADQQMEFVARVSHELRTPIAGISSLSQNLADGVVRDIGQAETYGKTIHRESRRLADMVEKVLQFSVMRSGKRRYEFRPVELSEVIDGALDAVRSDAPQGFQFETAIEDLPPMVGDGRALRSAIQNLLSNAVKFANAPGVVTVSARVAQGDDRRRVELSVDDRGGGIPPQELSQIFEPFYRTPSAWSGQVEGSGLGLSLVREVAEAHGGEVTVTSRDGVGSTFTLHLPVAAAQTPEVERDDG